MKQRIKKRFETTVDAALGWVAKLRSDAASNSDREAFALWLSQDKSHREAMDDALELWDDLGVVRHIPDAAEKSLRAAPAEAANRSRWLPAAAAIAASLVLAALLWPQLATEPVSTQYQTSLGERRDVELPDGSRAVMNTNSSLRVTFEDDQRHILLERGEAWFQVKSDPTRPFHVDAGDARVTALGTAFNVYRHDDNTDITVTEGVVRVTGLRQTGARAAAAEVLRENQKLLTSPLGWDIKVPDLTQELAWQQGQLIAREMPLLELLAQLQRYYATDILVTDPDIGKLTVSGIFDLDQPEAILRALALSLDLKTEAMDANTVRLLKTDP